MVVPQRAGVVGRGGAGARAARWICFAPARSRTRRPRSARAARRSRRARRCRGTRTSTRCRAATPARYVARGAALIGDAVHVTNPTAGQGMTMAIEDAAALARHVAPAARGGRRRRGARRRAGRLRARAAADQRRPAALVALDGPLLRDERRGGRPSCRARVFALGGHAVGQWIQRRVWSRVATRPGRPRRRLAPHRDRAARRWRWSRSRERIRRCACGPPSPPAPRPAPPPSALDPLAAVGPALVPGLGAGGRRAAGRSSPRRRRSPPAPIATQPALLALLLWGILFDGTHVVGTYARSYLAPRSGGARRPARRLVAAAVRGRARSAAVADSVPARRRRCFRCFLQAALLWAY